MSHGARSSWEPPSPSSVASFTESDLPTHISDADWRELNVSISSSPERRLYYTNSESVDRCSASITTSPSRARGFPKRKKTKRQEKKRGKSEAPNMGDIATYDMEKMENMNFQIGGLGEHKARVRENVIAPMINPEVFRNMNNKLGRSKGILFHGPPGTGKTLMARYLVQECKKMGLDVTFYAKNSSDILSKYVGQAEKQLRNLFEQAKKTSPSVIFFDEIDGLAPVRTAGNDRSTSSTVSTLLAAMDGMEDRGQVVVIGATNRPDALDPALRRPGRFDMELAFGLPDERARRQILDIHAPKGMSASLLDRVAQRTGGFSGADLEQLCNETAMIAIRRLFPEMHKAGSEHLLKQCPADRGTPCAEDMEYALMRVKSSAARHTFNPARALPKTLLPLFEEAVHDVRTELRKVSMPLFQKQQENVGNQIVFDYYHTWNHPCFVVCAEDKNDWVTKYVVPEILHQLEHVPLFVLDLQAMSLDKLYPNATTYVAHMFAEADRRGPAIIYIPNLDRWYDSAEPILRSTLVQSFQNLKSSKPVVLLCTINKEFNKNDFPDLRTIVNSADVCELDMPDRDQEVDFLQHLFDEREQDLEENKLRNEKIRREEEKANDMAKRFEEEVDEIERKRLEWAKDRQERLQFNNSRDLGYVPTIKNVDLSKEIILNTTVLERVHSHIKQAASMLKKPSNAPLHDELDIIIKKAKEHKYNDFHAFNQAVQILHSDVRLEKRGGNLVRIDIGAMVQCQWKIDSSRLEYRRNADQKNGLVMNEWYFLRELAASQPNGEWFYKPLLAQVAWIKTPKAEGVDKPLSIAYEDMFRELFFDATTFGFHELAHEIADQHIEGEFTFEMFVKQNMSIAEMKEKLGGAALQKTELALDQMNMRFGLDGPRANLPQQEPTSSDEGSVSPSPLVGRSVKRNLESLAKCCEKEGGIFKAAQLVEGAWAKARHATYARRAALDEIQAIIKKRRNN